MDELIKVLAKIVNNTDGKKYSLLWLIILILLFLAIASMMLFFSYQHQWAELFVEIGKISFILFSILCFLGLLSYGALNKVEAEKTELNKKQEIDRASYEALQEKFKKIETNQEGKLLLLLNEYDGECTMPDLRDKFFQIFKATVDSSVFYGLKKEWKPEYSLLRKKMGLAPFIDYERGGNVFLKEEGKKYIEETFMPIIKEQERKA